VEIKKKISMSLVHQVKVLHLPQV